MYFLDTDRGRLDATQEQIDIINAAINTKDNLLINALAGAAKSTTLQFICKYITGIPILSLAFNKRIADELQAKLPSHVECRTLNALGHRVWAAATGKRLVLQDRKTTDLVKAYGDELRGADKNEFFESFGDLLRAIGWAKSRGYIPKDVAYGTALEDEDSFFAFLNSELDTDAEDLVRSCTNWVLRQSIKMAYNGVIDFNDQIYMPTLFGGSWPAFPLVMVDETQDLSPLNHVMLQKLVGTRRLIAVGDPWQSIYGFRGAARSGMEAIKRTFDCTELTLSTTFRCPRFVVERQWDRVPHFRAAEWAIDGEIHHRKEWGAADIPDGAGVICRNNAPLFRLALNLLRDNRSVKVLGADIGPGLVKILKKLGPGTLTGADLHDAIDTWARGLIAKGKNASATEDRAECLHVFADAGVTLAGAIAYTEDLFKRSGTIQLMSGHKSKGLEFDHVFHLDPFRVPSKWARDDEAAMDQELNLKYVIETRAKRSLSFVNLEDYR